MTDNTRTNRRWWLPAAADAVNRAFWPPRQAGQRQWFLIMPCLWWVVLWYVAVAFYAVKVCLWAAVLLLLAVAQVLWLPFTIGQQPAGGH